MQEKIHQYHLHKDDSSKLHFEIKDIHTHLEKYPTHVYKAHRHSFFQFIWFKKAGKHFVDYELIDHPANAFFLLNRNQVHYFYDDVDNEGLLYHFDELFLHRGKDEYRRKIEFQLFSEVGKPYIVLDELTINFLELTTKYLQKEIADKKYSYREMIFSQMQSIVLAIDRLKYYERGAVNTLDANQALAIRFKQHVETNIDQFLTLLDYATHLGISTKKLSAISKEYFLKSPAKFISSRKILEAKRLLSNVDISIKEVAYKLGFDQPTYFTKYFKKHTGFTPKAFVKQLP